MEKFRIVYDIHQDLWFATCVFNGGTQLEQYPLAKADFKLMNFVTDGKDYVEVDEITFNSILNEQGVVRVQRPSVGYRFNGEPVIS